MAKLHKDLRPLVKQLKDLGFHIESGGKHALIKSIEGKVVGSLPLTPSDHRTMKNTISDLRRAGVLPPKQGKAREAFKPRAA